MSCGQNRLALKIRLMKYVAGNKEWKCRPLCFSCKYWEHCYFAMLCEEGEIEDRYEWEYRVTSEDTTYYTVNYHEAAYYLMQEQQMGKKATLAKRPIYSDLIWVHVV